MMISVISADSFCSAQAVLHTVLQGHDARERIGALKVLLAFCVANSEGQQALISGTHLSESKGSQATGLLIWLARPITQML